jgi:CRISPR-associated protein Cas2
MNSYLVCYDISDPKRLRKVATTCEDYGVRKQLSVFLCRLSDTDYVRLRVALHGIIDHQADQVLFIPLCARCVDQIDTLGRSTEPADKYDNVIVV